MQDLKYRLDDLFQYVTIDEVEFQIDNYHNTVNTHSIDSIDITDEYAHRYPNIFSDDTPTSVTHDFTYKVMLQNFDHSRVRLFYANSIQAKQIADFVTDGLANGVLRTIDDDSTLVALAPVFPIFQHGKCRVVTDFREINKALIFQADVIPPINLLIQNLFPFHIFSSLDLKSAYYNVPLDPTGCKIGITTIQGNYEFRKLPFGLASSPSVFVRFMRYILSTIDYDTSSNLIQC